MITFEKSVKLPSKFEKPALIVLSKEMTSKSIFFDLKSESIRSVYFFLKNIESLVDKTDLLLSCKKTILGDLEILCCVII